MKEQNYMKYIESHSEELLAIYIDLFNACINNNQVKALEILDSDEALYLDYNIGGDDEKNTAFIIACYYNMYSVIDRFIEMFSKINHIFFYNKNPMFDLNKQNNRGNTALMGICYNGLQIHLQDIIKRGGIQLNVNLQNNSGETAIMIACKSKNEECIKILLLCKNIDITLKKKDGTDMFNYISEENLTSLIYTIIPLVQKQYYDKYYNTIYNTLKKTNLDTNQMNRITKLNNIKQLISRNKLEVPVSKAVKATVTSEVNFNDLYD
jgi:ankyrin repeat protein